MDLKGLEVNNLLEQWQKDMGIKAVNELAEKGLVAIPKDWINKIEENAPNWLFFEMIKRLNEKIDNLKITSI
jgi:hypothetical protein